MKREKSILTAFILNLCFSVFEFIGGIYTGSVAITSDALHDIGDAASIGVSYFLERKSTKEPDERYTYGYGRYSVIGGAVTTLILLFGSVAVIYNAIGRIINPIRINYDGMIFFAIAGVVVNSAAAFFTHHGESLNQRAVNLHMIEDVFGWIVVLVGAFLIKFTDFVLIDPIMSVGVSIFIIIHALEHLKEIIEILLDKVPEGIKLTEVRKCIEDIDGVVRVYNIHIKTIDGKNNYASMHIVANEDNCEIRKMVREKISSFGIENVTIEVENN